MDSTENTDNVDGQFYGEKLRDTARLEAFSDGVFSVAITLLVLNIAVPHLSQLPAPTTLAAELLKQWPAYLSYIISFITVGIVWANHHNSFSYIVQSDHSLRIRNLILLMTVTLIPFTTALLSEYIDQPTEQGTAAFVFSLGWTALGLAYFLMWRYAVNHNLLDPRLTQEEIKQITARNSRGVVFYFVSLAVAPFSAALSVIICLGLAIYYLIS